VTDPLLALAASELAFPGNPNPALRAARRLAGDILARHGEAVEAVLLYGSCRRTGDASGLLDLYVLTASGRAFHGGGAAALRNALLPPDVLHWRLDGPDGPLRAKVAVMTLRAFERRMRPGAIDTTLWARFCQPATLLHARTPAARLRVEAAVAQAVETAVSWALRLGAPPAPPAALWRTLFAATYGAELRAERGNRPEDILAHAPAWFDAALAATLARPGARPAGGHGAWRLRRALGKPLNAARLVKAAFTFDGGPDYLADKIARHSGVPVTLTPWQRRHPILAAPLLLWRLRRRGAVR